MELSLPVYGVVYSVSAYHMGKLPNALPKQVVRGSNPLARSKHKVHVRRDASHGRDGGLERHALPSPLLYLHRGGLMKQTIMLGLAVWCIFTVTGCHYYEEYRVLKSTADLQDERAELLKAYRLCLTKYQDEPLKAKEMCGPYMQSLREIEIRQQHGR